MTANGSNKRGSRSRKVVLVDLENMLFGQHETPLEVVEHRSAQILSLAEARRPTDQVIVGCNPQLAFIARELFPNARLVTGTGKDGADLALLATVDPEHIAQRFSELCIVSGDHVFSVLAHDARIAGLGVRVVAPHAGLSTSLRLQANTSILLPELISVHLESVRSDIAA